jgi:hypothetical protein
MSDEERQEVESVRLEVTEAKAYFVARGGRLLPNDLHDP